MDREELEQTICAALLIDPGRARLKEMRYEIGLNAEDFSFQSHKDIWEFSFRALFDNCFNISDPIKLIREAATGVLAVAGYRGMTTLEAKSYMRELADCGVQPEDGYNAAIELRRLCLNEELQEIQKELDILDNLKS